MLKKLKFGIIGCSQIAESSVIPAILKSKHVELEIVGSRSFKKAEDFSKKFSCKNFGSYDDVINSDVDVIYVSLPVGLHEEWSIKAAKAGKNILCEKSSTTSFESAKKIINVCKENNVKILEALMFRFHPQHKKVLNLINSSILGKVVSFHGNYGLPHIPYDNIRHKKELGGGVLNDAGCYPICASRIVFQSEPKSVICNLEFDNKSKVDTVVNLYMNYSKNRHASLTVGYDLFYQSTYSIWGDKGILELKRSYNIPEDTNAMMILKSTKEKEIFTGMHNHFVLMVDHFSQVVKKKIKPYFNFEQDLLNQAKILQAARISNKENRTVFISEFS
jgi:D-xylose 1-dehydrogenase (NADP+, D-xylono-1,5-lactone-forming)